MFNKLKKTLFACAMLLATPALLQAESNDASQNADSPSSDTPALTFLGIFDPLVCSNHAPSLVDRLVESHDRAFLYFNWQVANADAYLGRSELPADTLPCDSFFGLELAFSVDKNAKKFGLDPGIDAQLAIPRIEARLHAFVDNTKPATLPGSGRDEKRDDFGTGFQAFFLNQSNLHVNAKGGIKFRSLPVVFGLGSISKQTSIGKWNPVIKQEVFWYSDDGFGEFTEGSLTYFIAKRIPLSLHCGAKWAEPTWGVEFSQSLALGYIIAEDDGYDSDQSITARASVFEHKNGPFLMDNYRFNVRYRRHLFHGWLYGEIMPQVEFPYDEEYEPQFSIELALNILFFRNTQTPGCQ